MDGSFAGKRGLVLGCANRRSIAWAIARQLAEAGATLAFTYQGERIEKNVRELAESVGSPLVMSCDVRADNDLERVFGYFPILKERRRQFAATLRPRSPE